jgi:putative FmdB family regulatory protein
MPLYEYRCAKCAQTFEVIQKFSDQPVAEHTGCGGAVERLVSAPALQFKGSGWYITDYAGHGKEKPKDKDKGKDPNGSPQGEAKPDSKGSDSKSETKSSSSDSGSSASTTSSPAPSSGS